MTASLRGLLDFEKRSRGAREEKAPVQQRCALSAEPKDLLHEDAFRTLLARREPARRRVGRKLWRWLCST